MRDRTGRMQQDGLDVRRHGLLAAHPPLVVQLCWSQVILGKEGQPIDLETYGEQLLHSCEPLAANYAAAGSVCKMAAGLVCEAVAGSVCEAAAAWFVRVAAGLVCKGGAAAAARRELPGEQLLHACQWLHGCAPAARLAVAAWLCTCCGRLLLVCLLWRGHVSWCCGGAGVMCDAAGALV